MVAADGYTLALARPTDDPARTSRSSFTVPGPDGSRSRRTTSSTSKRAAPGRRTPRPHRLPARPPGAVRATARGRPTSTSSPGRGASSPTSTRPAGPSRSPSATDLAVPGQLAAPAGAARRPGPARSDGYTVTLTGDLTAGRARQADADGDPRRSTGHRPAALPRRLRPPRRAARAATSPTCTCTRTAARATARRVPGRDRVPRRGAQRRDLPPLPRLPAPTASSAPRSSGWTRPRRRTHERQQEQSMHDHRAHESHLQRRAGHHRDDLRRPAPTGSSASSTSSPASPPRSTTRPRRRRSATRRRCRGRRPARSRRARGLRARGCQPRRPPRRTDRPRRGATAVASLRHRLLVSAVLTVPVVALAMVPAWQFDYWQWLSLTLAAPVVVWGALPFHRAAWTNLRHGTSTMDTLISMGTLAAFGWSLYALFLGTAGTPGMTHPFELTIQRERRRRQHLPRGRRRSHHVHPRRPLLRGALEAPGRRRAARAARDGRQGRGAARDGHGTETRVPVDRARASATGSSSGRARRSPPTASSRRAPPRSTPRCSPASRCRSRSGRRLRRRRHRQRGRSARRPRHPGRLATPSSPRWPAWSRTRRTARRRCSGSPTGSPGSSCRS